jgi:hypothetical protein
MKPRFHTQMTRSALPGLSETCIQKVIDANLGQDAPIGGVFVPQYHFDDCCFRESINYIAEQRQIIRDNCSKTGCDGLDKVLAALGRILHAIQDFYSHTNWVETRDEIWDGESIPEGLLSGIFGGRDCCPEEKKCPSHGELKKDEPDLEQGFFPKAIRLARKHSRQISDQIRRDCPMINRCC